MSSNIDNIIRRFLVRGGLDTKELQDLWMSQKDDPRIEDIRRAAEDWLSGKSQDFVPGEKEIDAWIAEKFPVNRTEQMENQLQQIRESLSEREKAKIKPQSGEKMVFRAVMGVAGVGLTVDGTRRLISEKQPDKEETPSWASRVGAIAEVGVGACLSWAALVSEKGRGIFR